MKNRIVIILLLINVVVCSVYISAETPDDDQIMMADIPFTYGEDQFISRITRKAEGREPVGLVLSGGSARAFAHIGVLRRMEELGIVPDFIIANSMGSIVGLLYGAGFSPDQISEIIQSTDIAELFRVAMPVKGGIIDVSRFSGLLYNYTGNIDLKDLPIPVMVLCEDLKTKRLVRIAEGDFMKVMQAAYALPVYFDPVEYNDHLLIDGGIANLVPLDAAYEYSDTVIASTAFYQNPKLNLRNPITNINVALDIGKSRTGVSQIKQYEPLLIRCNVESFSFMEFGSLVEIQAAGYESAYDMSSRLLSLNASGMTEELEEIRQGLSVRIQEAVERYRKLESIPVLEPTALVTAGLGIFSSPGSPRYLNDDLHLTAGIDFSYGYFSAAASAGAGTDMSQFSEVFPVVDFNISRDIAHAVRIDAEYTLRLENPAVLFDDTKTLQDFWNSSNVYAGIDFVPLATEHFRLALLGSGELAINGISVPADSLLTLQAGFSADSNQISEENYRAALFFGGQLLNQAGVFSADNTVIFADLEVSVPVPGTSGLFRVDSRGFTRRPVSGVVSSYYLRDGMRSTVNPGEYTSVNFASAEIVLNPYNFRPAVAELFMFKEIEIGIFAETGWFDQYLWSSGLSLSMDLSLIGLKPLKITSFAGFDSLSGGITGGISIIP